jgi:hypothetical protein
MNIYQILESLKRVEEGQMKHHMWDMAERMSLEKFLDMFPDSEDFYLGVHGVDSREELDQDDSTAPAQPGSWTPERIAAAKSKGDWVNETDDDDYESDEGDYADTPGVHAQVNRAGFNALTPQSYADKIDFIDRQLADPRQQQNWPEFKQRRLDLMTAAQRAGIVKEGSKFKFANPKQKPGDQVRGTEKAVSKKGQHPFKGRLVGAMEGAEIADEARATKTRLDPKCWKGYKKQGTKVKGGVRVNNCVPMEEEWETYINEFGADNPGQQSQTPQDQARELATTQQSLNKLKSAGANITNVQQAARTVLKPQDKPMDPTDMKQLSGWGKDIEQMIDSDDPAIISQLASLMQKAKKG